MATIIRSELSKKNKYYIEKHRYYELKHFCMQYSSWKQKRSQICLLSSPSFICSRKSDSMSPTELSSESHLYFDERIRIVEESAYEAALDLKDFMLKSVTEEISYECLRTFWNLPCCKDVWYEMYRKFFWILDKKRD